ncbi:hypothetical protein LY78DRAFT_85446 [Colletotrichum sublineola]|nr:hypothetical protein LY78DRAFT_85446 [Colletotrichum sublineola]
MDLSSPCSIPSCRPLIKSVCLSVSLPSFLSPLPFPSLSRPGSCDITILSPSNLSLIPSLLYASSLSFYHLVSLLPPSLSFFFFLFSLPLVALSYPSHPSSSATLVSNRSSWRQSFIHYGFYS